MEQRRIINMAHDSIGKRMKEYYESRSKQYLMRRVPVIIRLDGVCFHTLLKNAEKPFDMRVVDTMVETATYIVRKIQGAKLAYVQSDEISILVTDDDTINTSAWFDYNVQKIVSVSSSMATLAANFYNQVFNAWSERSEVFFDSRVFNIPHHEVANYFIWRQIDWNRNSLAMLCQQYFSHKELYGKNTAQRHEMLHSKGVNWAELTNQLKNGTFINRDGMVRHHKLTYCEDWKSVFYQ